MVTWTNRLNRRYREFLKANPIWFVFLIGIIIVIGVDRYAKQEPPQDLKQRIDYFKAVGMPAEAEQMYQQLLAGDRLHLDLHYAFLENHLAIIEAGNRPKDDQELVNYYTFLTMNPATQDIGMFGLGFLAAAREDFSKAIELYSQIQDKDQKYLNYVLAKAYQGLDEPDLAEKYFLREITVNGYVSVSVKELASLYADQNKNDQLRSLVMNSQTAPFVELADRRKLAYLTGDIIGYLKLTVLGCYQAIEFTPSMVAVLICLVWVNYFRRIDIFKKEPLWLLLCIFFFGAVTAVFALLLGDLIKGYYPFTCGESRWCLMMASIVRIGLVEEVVKFLPVLVILFVVRRVSEPFDLVVYGSFSALGFATLENMFYFSRYGLEIAFFRFFFSTLMHLSMTSIICYAWAKARFIFKENSLIALLRGLLIAATIHGLFDFFVLNPTSGQYALGMAIAFIMAREYYRMLRNTLNFSPFFNEDLASSCGLKNNQLLLSAGVILLLIAFLYSNFEFSTEIARSRTLQIGIFALPTMTAVIGPLGKLGLSRGKFNPLLIKIKLKEPHPGLAGSSS